MQGSYHPSWQIPAMRRAATATQPPRRSHRHPRRDRVREFNECDGTLKNAFALYRVFAIPGLLSDLRLIYF